MVDTSGNHRRGLHPDLRLRVLRLDPTWTGNWIDPGAERERSLPVVDVPPETAVFSTLPNLEPTRVVFDAMTAPIPGLTDA